MHAAIRNGESSTDGPRGSGLARTSGDFKPAGLASQTCELVPAHVSPDAVAIKPCTGAAVASGGAQARLQASASAAAGQHAGLASLTGEKLEKKICSFSPINGSLLDSFTYQFKKKIVSVCILSVCLVSVSEKDLLLLVLLLARA